MSKNTCYSTAVEFSHRQPIQTRTNLISAIKIRTPWRSKWPIEMKNQRYQCPKWGLLGKIQTVWVKLEKILLGMPHYKMVYTRKRHSTCTISKNSNIKIMLSKFTILEKLLDKVLLAKCAYANTLLQIKNLRLKLCVNVKSKNKKSMLNCFKMNFPFWEINHTQISSELSIWWKMRKIIMLFQNS